MKLVLALHVKNCTLLSTETRPTKRKHSCSNDEFSKLPAEVLLKPWDCLVYDPPVAVNDMLLEPSRVAKKVCSYINVFQTKVRQLVNVAIRNDVSWHSLCQPLHRIALRKLVHEDERGALGKGSLDRYHVQTQA